MVPPKNEWWCEALLCYKRAGLWTMYLEKIKNLGQNGGAGPGFGGMERSRLCARKYRYRHLQESESRSHQPSHESFCIRARLQTCRNGSTTTWASAPEGPVFCEGQRPHLLRDPFGPTKKPP